MARENKKMNIVPNKVRKPRGLKKNGLPNAYWRRFEERLRSFDNSVVSNWKEEDVLGYLLKKYEEHYGINFSLSFSGAPTRCPEMFCVRRMMVTLGTQDPEIAKKYIDWVFEKIIDPQKTKVETLAFFFTQNLCNRFKAAFKKQNTITRSTQLPQDYLDVVEKLNLPCLTYGDLIFAKMAIEQDPDRVDLFSYIALFEDLKNIGFDLESLENIEN